jgi:hypothetical protein
LARNDLDGTYQTARSIDEYAHIVTSSTLNLSSTLYQKPDPFTEEDFADMNVTEFTEMLPMKFSWDPLITLATARD